ncbi:MAG: phytoene/squalene synthase family protein [Gemmatimonadales bacterium]|nr:phytoene/squalene synthase family protein [Gemmatimonadales bacterium]
MSSTETGPQTHRGGISPSDGRAFCAAMLPKVSRTFALCIRLLPRPLAESVTIAYLLCRIADTVEDAVDLSVAEKRELLSHFNACLDREGPDAAPLREAFVACRNDEEHLAFDADIVLGEFRALSPAEQEAVRPWVQEMCLGMAEFARAGRQVPGATLEALNDLAELDRYCYYVAGTVGHLLTGLFRLSDARADLERYAALDQLATSFGLGLQLTNIIKDVADDHHRGWSFVPQDLCVEAGVPPEKLFDPAYRTQSRQVMDTLIQEARRHLADSLQYCTLLPHRLYRVRLFCLTSFYFAVRTLRRAEHDQRLLEPAHKLKITRARCTVLLRQPISWPRVTTWFERIIGAWPDITCAY